MSADDVRAVAEGLRAAACVPGSVTGELLSAWAARLEESACGGEASMCARCSHRERCESEGVLHCVAFRKEGLQG